MQDGLQLSEAQGEEVLAVRRHYWQQLGAVVRDQEELLRGLQAAMTRAGLGQELASRASSAAAVSPLLHTPLSRVLHVPVQLHAAWPCVGRTAHSLPAAHNSGLHTTAYGRAALQMQAAASWKSVQRPGCGTLIPYAALRASLMDCMQAGALKAACMSQAMQAAGRLSANLQQQADLLLGRMWLLQLRLLTPRQVPS